MTARLYIPEAPSLNYLLDLFPPPPKYPNSDGQVIATLHWGPESLDHVMRRRNAGRLTEEESKRIDTQRSEMIRLWKEEVERRVDVFHRMKRKVQTTYDLADAEAIFFAEYPELAKEDT